ncbi:uncharacterized protein N7482_005442 [Penicillium canariense]|uniref:Uncharacterized protein n=1 Tax=Penicillium canariense TaxID=189055 RepID=A0A9W9LN04_9EURO|nr:uncharacterized protein N7482_005442 [Penicillium canariense]KAJ5166661.1 hypothetical protein N7482_005442 [Penicillium canariense]
MIPLYFVTCDFISLSLQGAGGGLAATATTNHGSAVGNNIMMAGIVRQVVTLSVFGTLSVQFFVRIRNTPMHALSVEAQKVWESRKFRWFCWGIVIAFVTTYARCVYRIAEMSGGWKNKIMQDEVSFIIFESGICAVALMALCVAHPGYCFEQKRGNYTRAFAEDSVLPGQKAENHSNSSMA